MSFQSGEWADVPSASQQQQPELPKRLCVVLPFVPREIEQVKSLLKTSKELSDQIPRTIFLLPFKGINTSEIESLAKQSFNQVGIIKDGEGVTSDWQDGQLIRSASGPNSLFRQAAWFFYLSNGRLGHWLWLEPDCTPTGKRWLLDLEQEYFEIGKPFMGVKMVIGDGRQYMNGVGIYPWNAIQYAPLLVQSTMWKQHPDTEVGFDVAGGADVLSNAHLTRKIQLELKKDKIDVRPETVLLHGNITRLILNPEYETASYELDLGTGQIVPREQILSGVVSEQPCAASHIAAESESERPRDVDAKKRSEPTPAQTNFKDGDGVTLDGLPLVHPDYKTAPYPPPIYKDDYGAVSKEIRARVQNLVQLWNDQPHRKVLIVKELRKAKLVPKHFR